MLHRIFFLVISLLLALNLVAQTSHYVNSSTDRAPEHFANLQTAVDMANAGDTIYIHPGSNVGSATVTKKLHLLGHGYNISSNYDEYGVNIGMPNNLISTLNLNAGSDSTIVEGISFTSLIATDVSHLILRKNRVAKIIRFNNCDSSFISQSYFSSINSSLGYSLRLEGNSRYNFISNNIFAHYNSNSSYHSLIILADSDAIVQHNVFRDQCVINTNTIFTNNISLISEGVAISANGTAVVQHNVFARNETSVSLGNIINYGQSGICLGFPSSNGLSFDKLYTLDPTGPAIGYASHGGDCGVFDGTFPYKLSGVPNRPIITDVNISNVVPNNGLLQISIKTNAQN